jgi:hypothetical protein
MRVFSRFRLSAWRRRPPGAGRGRRRADHGMVTVELAMALPVLMIMVGAGLAAVSVAAAHVRALDAAREAARAAARGDMTSANALAHRLAPGASVSLSSAADRTTARVSMVIRPPGGWPAITVVATAVAATEPGDDADPDSNVTGGNDAPDAIAHPGRARARALGAPP